MQSICVVRNFPFREQTNSFFLMCNQRFYNFEETQKTLEDVIEKESCSNCRKQMYLFSFKPKRTLKIVYRTVKKAERTVTSLKFFLKNKNRQGFFSVEMVRLPLPERRVITTQQKNRTLCWKNFSVPIRNNHNQTGSKRQKNHSVYGKTVSNIQSLILLLKIFFASLSF